MEKEKKNKSKKLVVILSAILGILVLIFLILPFVIRLTGLPIGNMIFEMQMKNVDKDIKITIHDGMINPGGYAETYIYYYIDIDKKKIYKVEDYFVYGVTSYKGEGGHHYSLKTKELSDFEIDEILKLVNIETQDENKEVEGRYIKYIVSYKDKNIGFTSSQAPIIAQVIGGM